MITVDLRNHGSSGHSDDMEYESMCEDVENLLKNQLDVNQAIVLGHSMGGKVAITMSLTKVSCTSLNVTYHTLVYISINKNCFFQQIFYCSNTFLIILDQKTEFKYITPM